MSDARSAPPSELRGRYLVQNVALRAWLSAADGMLGLMRRRTPGSAAGQPFRRILVGVGGHLGDAVIASAALAEVQRRAPGAEIGVVCGSWAAKVLKSIPHVRRIHTVDHWKQTRSGMSLPRRFLAYLASATRSIREIRAARYDAAVDLYSYYPNFAAIMALGGVPVRVGFGTGGFGPLYTSEVAWIEGRAVREDHMAAVDGLLAAGERGSAGAATYSLGPMDPAGLKEGEELLAAAGLSNRAFVILHVGGSVPQRDWPIDHWIEVARRLVDRGMPVVMSGAGPADQAKIATIANAVPAVIDLCDRLPWPIFRVVVDRAVAMLCVNTVAIHLSAAEDTPCVAVMSGIDAMNRWHSGRADMRFLSHPVPCAPCHRTRGCAEMTCVRGVTPDAMMNAVEPWLAPAATTTRVSGQPVQPGA